MRFFKKEAASLALSAILSLANPVEAKNNPASRHCLPGFFFYMRPSTRESTELTSYNPYAFSYHSSGIVGSDAKYSPYALSYHNSGLVPSSYSHYPQKPLEIAVEPGFGNCPNVIPNYQSAISPPKPQSIPSSQEQSSEQKRKEDGKYLILSWLRERNFSDFTLDRSLSTQSGTISANFISCQRKIIINYQNKEEIERLKDIQKKMFDKYSPDLEAYLSQKSQEGFKIAKIAQEDNIPKRLEEILK